MGQVITPEWTQWDVRADAHGSELSLVAQAARIVFLNAWNFGGRRNVRTIILTLICHYSGMNGKVVFSIPFLLDQEVILLRHSLLMDQVPVFLPMEPRLAPYGRPL